MDTCASLARERETFEHLLSQTSNAKRRQEILDQLDDINTKQQDLGCFDTTDSVLVDGRITVWNLFENRISMQIAGGSLSIVNWSNEAYFSFTPVTFATVPPSEIKPTAAAHGQFNAPSAPSGSLDLQFFLRIHAPFGSFGEIQDKDVQPYLSTRDTITTIDGVFTGQPIDPATGNFALVGDVPIDDPSFPIQLQITGTFK